MDSKTCSDNVIVRKARLFELQKETEVIRDELMLWIGKAQAYAEVEAKIKELEEKIKPQ